MHAIFKILDDPIIRNYGYEPEHMFGANSTDTPSSARFIEVTKGDFVKSFGTKGYEFYTIWVHLLRSEGVTYTDINKVLSRIVQLMTTASQVLGEDDCIFVESSFAGMSPEQVDDGYNSVTRNVSFRVASRWAYMG